METKKFYDIHMHAFDLSHPNLLAFIDRAFDNISHNAVFKFFKRFPVMMWFGMVAIFLLYFYCCATCLSHCCSKGFCEMNPGFIFSGLVSLMGTAALIWIAFKIKGLKKKPNEILNCLSVMENPLEYQFLMLEYFLKNYPLNKTNPLIENNKLKIGKEKIYDKIILCPLIMDFGKKNLDQEGIFYNLAPQKPIVKQVVDLLNASKAYYEKIVVKSGNHVKWKDRNSANEKEKELFDEKLFEIYPFIGLNTRNYTVPELESMLNKYFKGYESDTEKNDRMNKLSQNAGKFHGDIYDNNVDFSYYFAGIKVYPPLGFNPMPNRDEALDRVQLLYEMAQTKRIPIITHCSDGGFKTDKNSEKYTNPGKAWSEVLKIYPKLKLCFAHFGHQESNKKEWQDTIIQLIEKYDNVFTDISCCSGSQKYYEDLYQLICNHPKLKSRILFGTDFSINLFTGESSYNSYIETFKKYFNNEFTEWLCSRNSEEFLFGN